MINVPKLVVLNLTNDCNMKCEYCYASAGDNNDYMKIETAIKIVDEIKRINGDGKIKILFHGGEPLMCYDVIKKVIEHCKEKYDTDKIDYYIQTNCVLLDREKIIFLKKNNVKISISIDGNDESTNACRILKNSSNSIEAIKKAIGLLHENNVEINALVVLNQKNHQKVSEIIDFFVEMKIFSFSFNYFIKGGRGNINSHLALSNAEVFEATKIIIDKIQEYYSKGIYLNEKNVYFMIKSILKKKKLYMCANSPCGAGLNIIGITPSGDIYPCDDLSSQKQFCLGNINEQNLDVILANDLMNYFAKCNYESIKECSVCDLKFECGAGCCSRKFYENNSIYSLDPICGFYKLIIPYIKDRINSGTINCEIYE